MSSRTLIDHAVRGALAGAAVAAMAAGPGGARAQGNTGSDTADLEEVIVTGTLIRGVDAETALPVTVISADEIAKSGVENLEQLVGRIASTATAGATRASDLAGLSTYGLSSVSLRGLGESRTLVLLNGRRLSVLATGTTSAVDINAIPLSAIERVEVLRDGASSSYGSDAVAGVMNFILRKDFNGAEISGEAGRPTEKGGGSMTRFGLLLGKSDLADGKVGFMLGGDVERSLPLAAKDRDFAASGNRYPYYQNSATPSGRIEGVWIPGQSQTANSRTTSNPYGYSSSGYGNPYAPDRCGDINMFAAQNLGGVGGNYPNCLFDSAPYVNLFPRTEHSDVFGTLKVEITDAAQFYAEGNYSRNRVTESFQPSPVNASFLSTDTAFEGSGVDPALLIYPSNPAYQSIVVPYLQSHGLSAMVGQPLAVTLRSFLTGLRTEQDINEQTRVLMGVRGDIGSWNYDVGALYNESSTSGTVIDGYFSQLALARVLNNSNWNPWALVQDPAITQAIQSAKYVGPTLSGNAKLESLDATVSGPIGQLPGGPLQLAFGATGRRETYTVNVPDILGSGDIAGLGGATLPTDNARTVAAAYGEVSMPVIKSVLLDASVRYDHYNDVGSKATGKLTARWQPLTQLLFRAAAGTGFRAPSLPELHQPITTQTSEEFIDPLFPADGPVQVNALNGGNVNLKPEKSKQGSFGVVVSPIPSLTAGFDYFYIKIDDYITNPTAVALITAVRAGHPLYGPNDATFNPDGTVDTIDETNHNAASVLVKGVDVNIGWNEEFSFGKLGLTLSGTYMDTYDLTTLSGVQHSVGTIVEPDGSTILDISSQGGVVPRWKHTLTLNYGVGPWNATLAQNFYSSYRDVNDLLGNRHDIPSTATYDAQLGFTGIPDLTLSVGAKNVFQKKPPLFIGTQQFNLFQYGYDPTMYDPRGRYVYVRAAYKFL